MNIDNYGESDGKCIEDDGCPTEMAVLQRYWRKTQSIQSLSDAIMDLAEQMGNRPKETLEIDARPWDHILVYAPRASMIPLLPKPDLSDTEKIASELWQALNDLSFECDAVFAVKPPSRETYNRTFQIMDKHRGLVAKFGK